MRHKPYLKAVPLDPAARRKRLDSFGVSYTVRGLPELWIHGSTHRAGNKGDRYTARSYRAVWGGVEVAHAGSLKTLLLRIERAGFQGFLRLLSC